MAHGLLEDDGEWRHSLDEAIHFQTSFILHGLFVVILRDCIPADPQSLWQQYKSHICDNLPCLLPCLGFHNVTQDAVEDYGLYLMQETLLWGLNRTLKDVGMVAPSRDWDSLLSNHLLQDHMQFDPAEEGQLLVQTVPLLNHEQRLAFD